MKNDLTFYLPTGDPRMDAAAEFLRRQGCGVVRDGAALYDRSVPIPGKGPISDRDIVYQNDEIFLSENADITAEAAIYLAMGDLNRTIAGSECLILGYGRIGKALAKKLIGLNANVTVQARSPIARAAAADLGCAAQEIGTGGRWDVIFNTVPAPVFAPPGGALCLDLASTPGFLPPEAGRSAHGLPGKYAPASAGEALGRCVHRLLKEGDA